MRAHGLLHFVLDQEPSMEECLRPKGIARGLTSPFFSRQSNTKKTTLLEQGTPLAWVSNILILIVPTTVMCFNLYGQADRAPPYATSKQDLRQFTNGIPAEVLQVFDA